MRQDQKLSQTYQKNQRFEKILQSLNDKLEESQDDLLEEIANPLPAIHILGPPRSGTTLVSQLISSYLNVAHINNLIATFWKAPIYGIELSKKLLGNEYKSSFSSDFGRTNGINEPHEFGYFWNYHLKYEGLQQKEASHESLIDWSRLNLLLNNMTNAAEKPIIFKSFLIGFHANTLYNKMPNAKFLYIKRNLADNVMSIMNLRTQLNGDINIWGSIKPKQYEELKNLDVIEQIVGQIMCLEHEYFTQLQAIPDENQIFYRYEELCNQPDLFINTVSQKFLNNNQVIKDINAFEIEGKKISIEQEQQILEAIDKIKSLFPDLKSFE